MMITIDIAQMYTTKLWKMIFFFFKVHSFLEIATIRASLTQRLAVIAEFLKKKMFHSVLGTNLDSNGKDEEAGWLHSAHSYK